MPGLPAQVRAPFHVSPTANQHDAIELTLADYEAMFAHPLVTADDDPIMQAFVNRVLDTAGHAVGMCDDGEALVEQVKAEHPDVVVTDNQMPIMSGLEAVEVLRADPETSDILAAPRTSAGPRSWPW